MSSDDTREPPGEYTVFLEAHSEPVGWLPRALRLDVWRDQNVNTSVAAHMYFGGILLCIVVIFDLFFWSILFWTVFSGGWYAWEWLALAVPFGILASAVTFIFEWQFFTADTADSWLVRYLTAFIRVLFILGSAWATALPVKNYWLGSDIEQRAMQEDARSALTHMYRYWDRDRTQNERPDEEDVRAAKNEAVEERAGEATTKRDEARTAVKNAEEALRQASESRRRAQASYDACGDAKPVEHMGDGSATEELPSERCERRRRALASARAAVDDRGSDVRMAKGDQSMVLTETQGPLDVKQADDARRADMKLIGPAQAQWRRRCFEEWAAGLSDLADGRSGPGADRVAAEAFAPPTFGDTFTPKVFALLRDSLTRGQCPNDAATVEAATPEGATPPTSADPTSVPAATTGASAAGVEVTTDTVAACVSCAALIPRFRPAPQVRNFSERIRILNDLLVARPPRWPSAARDPLPEPTATASETAAETPAAGAPAADPDAPAPASARAELAADTPDDEGPVGVVSAIWRNLVLDVFGTDGGDPGYCAEEQSGVVTLAGAAVREFRAEGFSDCTPTAIRRRKEDAAVISTEYWIAQLVGMFIPTFAMFTKLVSGSLRGYYNSHLQAASGNPAADAQVRAQRHLEAALVGRSGWERLLTRAGAAWRGLTRPPGRRVP